MHWSIEVSLRFQSVNVFHTSCLVGSKHVNFIFIKTTGRFYDDFGDPHLTDDRTKEI